MDPKKTLENYWIGKHVELHPALDDWMRGDRFAVVIGCPREGKLRIKFDHSGRERIIGAVNVTVAD
jgi:hypothetical protein